ncbi:hypothetical protein CJU89_6133 [Yarrowia sp. B02]|nr:hypothetical protein CJU89_6133 [Yarrowia sp. B02]
MSINTSFHLYRSLETHYILILENAELKHFENWVFHCGTSVQRFVPLNESTILVHFHDFRLQVLLATQDNWKTFKDYRISRPANFDLSVNSLYSKPPASGADAFIQCTDRPPKPVHSAVLAPKCPFFAAELKKSPTVTLDDSPSTVDALVGVFYDEKLPSLEAAKSVVLLATKYDLPEVKEYALRALYALDPAPEQAAATWKDLHKHSRAAALYCTTRIKCTPGEKHLDGFEASLTAEEKKAFHADMTPEHAIPEMFRSGNTERRLLSLQGWCCSNVNFE